MSEPDTEGLMLKTEAVLKGQLKGTPGNSLVPPSYFQVFLSGS